MAVEFGVTALTGLVLTALLSRRPESERKSSLPVRAMAAFGANVLRSEERRAQWRLG